MSRGTFPLLIAALVCIAFPGLGSAAVLVGYWPMDEGSGTTVSDVSGNGLHGTISGGVQWTTGQFGGALNFDTSTSPAEFVSIPHNSLMNFTTGFSVSYWVNAPQTQSGTHPLMVGKWNEGSSIGWFTARCLACIWPHFGTGAPLGGCGCGNPTLDNTWHHVALTARLDGNRIYALYIDGVAVVIGEVPANFTANTTLPLFFGAFGGGGGAPAGRQFVGKLDEVRLYNGVLTPAEVAALASGEGIIDCNANGIPDGFDISTGSSQDCNGNGIPDECELPGRALRFDGTNDFARVPSPSALPLGNAPRTVELWLRRNSSDTEMGIFVYGSYSACNQFGLVLTPNCPNKLGFFGFGAATCDLCSTNNVPVGPWTHVAATYDGTVLRLYMNGALEASANRALNTLLNASGLLIGTRNDINETWNGDIDEFRVWNYARHGWPDTSRFRPQ